MRTPQSNEDRHNLAEKSFIRKAGSGGGFLHGVSGVLVDYAFQTKTGKDKKGKAYTALSVKLSIRPDGATQPSDQYFNAGFLYGDNVVSADGKMIEGQDAYTLRDDTEWGKFLVSGIEKSLPEEALGEGRNYAGLMGYRVTFSRIIDEEGTINAGTRELTRKLGAAKAKTATREELLAAGKRKDKKTGKEYNRDLLLIAEVLAAPEVKGSKTTAAAKPAAAAANTDAADAVLQAILSTAAEKTIDRTKLNAAVLRYAVGAKLTGDSREALRKTIISDAYLNGAQDRGLIVIDTEAKTIVWVGAEEAVAV